MYAGYKTLPRIIQKRSERLKINQTKTQRFTYNQYFSETGNVLGNPVILKITVLKTELDLNIFVSFTYVYKKSYELKKTSMPIIKEDYLFCNKTEVIKIFFSKKMIQFFAYFKTTLFRLRLLFKHFRSQKRVVICFKKANCFFSSNLTKNEIYGRSTFEKYKKPLTNITPEKD